jgi:hypothetical protein
LRILDCEFAVIEPDPTAFDPLKLYDIFRRYLEHEDNLINSRLTWSLTIHGFLFASYGILLGKIADEFSGLPKPGAHALLGEHIIAALFALQALVAILGVLVGFSSRRAIIASHNAIQNLVTIAHSQGRPLEIAARGATVPLGSILLPRIVGGGAKILPPGERKQDHTVGARSYCCQRSSCGCGRSWSSFPSAVRLRRRGIETFSFLEWVCSVSGPNRISEGQDEVTPKANAHIYELHCPRTFNTFGDVLRQAACGIPDDRLRSHAQSEPPPVLNSGTLLVSCC